MFPVLIITPSLIGKLEPFLLKLPTERLDETWISFTSIHDPPINIFTKSIGAEVLSTVMDCENDSAEKNSNRYKILFIMISLGGNRIVNI